MKRFLDPGPGRRARRAVARAGRDAASAAEDHRSPCRSTRPRPTRILAALQVFPPDNPWNQDISGLPLHPDSDGA